MLSAIAARHDAVHVETLTGFKWLARADAEVPGGTLVYAYEEAIGHCVDPAAVRDKDGISAAVLVCDLVAALIARGGSVSGQLDELARRHGVHDVAAVSRRVGTDRAAELMQRLRTSPPETLAGFGVALTDITDALIFTGGDDDTSVRLVVRPSGTEPKVKCYLRFAARRATTWRLRGGTPAPCGSFWSRRCGAGEQVRPELAIPGIAEARHDVGRLVESLVYRGGEHSRVGRRFPNRRKAFRRGHHTQHGDVGGAATLQQPQGVHHRAAGGQHRVQHHHRPAGQLVGQRRQIRTGRWVCSSRATPTKPTSASGSAACAGSTMPSPARSTGTSSGGLTSRVPAAAATGVRIRTDLRGTSRLAS